MGCDMSFIKKVKAGGGTNGAIDDEMYEKRVLLLGLDNAGKTSILFQMRDNQFKTTVPTIGLNIETLTHKRYNFTFWDVGGQATKLWKHYFDKIDAVVFVIDSTDEEKLLFAKDEFKRLLKDESLNTIPFLILFNKCDDTQNAKSTEELSARLELDKAREEREIAISRCSAKLGEGIWEGIDLLIDIFDRRKNGAHLFPLQGQEIQSTQPNVFMSQIQQQIQKSNNDKQQITNLAQSQKQGSSSQVDSEMSSNAAKDTKISTGRGESSNQIGSQ